MWLDVRLDVLGEKPKTQPSPHRAHHVQHLDAKHWRLGTCGQACHRDPAIGRRVCACGTIFWDAVVHVQTAAVVPTQSNPWLSMLGMDPGRVAQGSGSGVILDRQGWIVTNHHVIDGAQRIQVALSDGSTMEAELIEATQARIWPSQGNAAKNLPTLSFGNSDEVNVGEWVLAVGNLEFDLDRHGRHRQCQGTQPPLVGAGRQKGHLPCGKLFADRRRGESREQRGRVGQPRGRTDWHQHRHRVANRKLRWILVCDSVLHRPQGGGRSA